MTNYTEFLEKAQTEFVTSLKQAQELNLKALASITDLFATVPTIDAKDAAATQLPTPTELVERAFAFTNTLVETRKEYAVKLAELATEAQKQFIETAKRVADAAKN
jgi:hypothetical protein